MLVVRERWQILIFKKLAVNDLRLGEGCLTDAQFSHEFQWQLLPNRCYLLGGLSVGT
jgi:hypothetical protein